jgi:transcription elongation factor GreA
MTESSDANRPNGVPLGAAFNEYLQVVRLDVRPATERYVRHYVSLAGESTLSSSLTGARVEGYAETYIRATDPLADERVAALKLWFQYLKRKNYTTQNFGTVVRVRRTQARASGSSTVVEVTGLEVTAEGLGAMQRELSELTGEVPSLVEAIALAREDKDFRENAPLDAAREALAQNEARRRQLQSDLKRARVVDDTGAERAGVGSAVQITRLDTGASFTYKLVGAREANAREGKISVASPVGSALVGARPGDEVSVQTPNGEVAMRVDGVTAG